MKHPDEEIRSVAEMLQQLKSHAPDDQPVWFRGQDRSDWNLTPSIARSQNVLDAELIMMKRFKQNALSFLTRPPLTEWDWLFYMQHYGLPTRLLDWSESPLVGLYFAVCNHVHHTESGALWCMLPKELNALSNYKPKHSMELPFVGVEDELELYLPETIARETRSELLPRAITSVRESTRIRAQLGVFTIMHREAIAVEHAGLTETQFINGETGNHVWRMVIPPDAKNEILDELNHLAINRLTLFPELPSVAEKAKEAIQ